MEERTESDEWWEQGSDDELRNWRREALQRASKAEEQAAEARRLRDLYERAAEEKEAEAVRAEQDAAKSEAEGDTEAAEAHRGRAAECREAAEKSLAQADEKARFALLRDREAQKEQALCVRLGNEVRRRARSWDPFV